MADIPFEAECAECGSPLNCEVKIGRNRWGHAELQMVIQLCKTCVDISVKEAKANE